MKDPFYKIRMPGFSFDLRVLPPFRGLGSLGFQLQGSQNSGMRTCPNLQARFCWSLSSRPKDNIQRARHRSP